MTEILNADWVKTHSPYHGNTYTLHLLIAEGIERSSEDHFAASRTHLKKLLHCRSEMTISNAEARMVRDGYLDARKTERYGSGCKEYRLLVPASLLQQSAAS